MLGDRGTKALLNCEAELRNAMAAASGEGDYEEVVRLAELGKVIGGLIHASEPTHGSTMEPASSTLDDLASGAESKPVPAKGSRATRASLSPYPRFHRRDDELVKVGWSKKGREEYSHRAPRRVVDIVGSAVRVLGARGRVFTGDKLLPLKDPIKGNDIASYQAYVALGWLKSLGLLEQRGRKAGYTLASGKPLEQTIESGWATLTEWRG